LTSAAAHHITTTTHDSAHDITQYRLERRDIVGITSLLTKSIPATVSIPLAGRPTAHTRSASFHDIRISPPARHAHQIHQTQHRHNTDCHDEVEDRGLKAAEEARLTQIAPCYRGGRRQQRKSSTKSAAYRERRKSSAHA
jgi:hypothetical protein